MSPENKQRVIGIVILVAFVALLIPFLFTNGIGKKVTKSDQIPILQEERQLATQQIDNTNNVTNVDSRQLKISNTTGQAPALVDQNSSPQAPVAADQKSMETTMPLSPQDPVATNERPSDVSFPPELSNNNKAPVLPLPALQSDAELTGKTNVVTATEIATIEEEPKTQKKIDETLLMDKMIKKSTGTKAQNKTKTMPIVNKKNNTIAKKAGIKKTIIRKTGNWSVQIGSFKNPDGANKLVNQLRSKGFKTYLQKVTKNDTTMIRVLVGSEVDKQTAEQTANKLSTDLNITGNLIRN